MAESGLVQPASPIETLFESGSAEPCTAASNSGDPGCGNRPLVLSPQEAEEAHGPTLSPRSADDEGVLALHLRKRRRLPCASRGRPCRPWRPCAAAAARGTSTRPEVPFGATTVSLNERPPRCQRDAIAPCGVGALPLGEAQIARLRGDDPVAVSRRRRPDAEHVARERRHRAAGPAVRQGDAARLRQAIELHALPHRARARGEHLPPGAAHQARARRPCPRPRDGRATRSRT